MYKRYVIGRKDARDYPNDDFKIELCIWDNLKEERVSLSALPPPEDSPHGAVYDLVGRLNEYIRELNQKYEDDLLYLDTVKSYANNKR